MSIETMKQALSDANAALKKAAQCIKDLGDENERLRQAIKEAEKQEPAACIPTSEFPAVKAAKLQVQKHMKYYNEMMKEPTTTDRIVECAIRLVEHADFKLGGVLSADSKAKDIPSKAVSSVKARHLAALRDALASNTQSAQPKREWVDLTPGERSACRYWACEDFETYGRAIEAKLKEKNT
jgi:hypothetical protein